MSATYAQTEFSGDTADPLDRLAGHFHDDMQAVNRVIMDYMQADVELIPRVAAYLIAAGGKRIRPLLTLAATQMHGGDMTGAHKLAAAVEFIHTATLLHDDVVDESDERRGQEAAQTIFGNKASVLVGDYLFARSFQLMVISGSLDVLQILSNASAEITQGEVMQLTTVHGNEAALAHYYTVIGAKTAALFAAACEVGPVMAEGGDQARKAMHDYGYNLGMAFQICDDMLDYMPAGDKFGKTQGDDFREAKLTAPAILARQHATTQEEVDFWERTMINGDQRDGDLDHARQLIADNGIDRRCYELTNDLADKARAALHSLPHSAERDLLDALIDFTLQRQY